MILPQTVLSAGTTEPLSPQRSLRAGQFTLQLEGIDLRYLCWRDHEVLRRIYVAVRDRNWGTVPPVYSNWQAEIHPHSFRLSFDVLHRQGEIDFAWQGEINGDKDGTLFYSMDGVARSTFWRNRIGFCVLHPRELAGAPVRIEHINAKTTLSHFPQNIIADQPVLPFSEVRALSHQIEPQVWAEVIFEGDIFEMEDQRNWTDASYKTFSTPLSLPYPVRVPAGTRIRQTITVKLRDERQAPRPVEITAPPRPLQIQLQDTSFALPSIGVATASHTHSLSPREIEHLTALHLQHLRVDLDLANQEYVPALVRATNEARALALPLYLALFLPAAPDPALKKLRETLDALRPPVEWWLVYPHRESVRGGEPLRELITTARMHLSSYDVKARFATGTNWDFIFMQRNPVPTDLLDAVCFAINPQVHAFDNASLVETLPAQMDVVNYARSIGSALPVIVSPVTFKMRFNPYASAPESPAPGELPSQVDLRQLSLFGAGWTAGSIKYLAQSGAAAVTYYETTGWRGVMESESGSPLPDKFPSQPGMLYPLYHVLADIGEFKNSQVIESHSSDPLKVDALALRSEKQTRVLVFSFAAEAQTVTVAVPDTKQISVKRLNTSTADQALRHDSAFRRQAGETLAPADGRISLTLLPYEIARLDFQA